MWCYYINAAIIRDIYLSWLLRSASHGRWACSILSIGFYTLSYSGISLWQYFLQIQEKCLTVTSNETVNVVDNCACLTKLDKVTISNLTEWTASLGIPASSFLRQLSLVVSFIHSVCVDLCDVNFGLIFQRLMGLIVILLLKKNYLWSEKVMN